MAIFRVEALVLNQWLLCFAAATHTPTFSPIVPPPQSATISNLHSLDSFRFVPTSKFSFQQQHDYFTPLELSPPASPAIPLEKFKDAVEFLPGLGRPNETQYAGFIPIDSERSESQLFYWLFQHRNESNLSNTPLIIWLQGGPGASSLYGSLAEQIGPYSVSENLTLTPNLFSWNQFAHVMFIDFPVGTGFSYSNNADRYIRNDEEAAEDMFAFLKGFRTRHPDLVSCPIFLAGESYAGKWIPAISDRFLNESVNLHGVVLVSPWVDPEAQIPAYITHADAFGLLTTKHKQHAELLMEQCLVSLRNGSMIESADLWDKVARYIYSSGGGFSPYDIRDVSGAADETGAVDRWLAQESVRHALNCGDHVWSQDNGVGVYKALRADDMVSSLPFLQRVLEKTQVLILNGQYDWVCNYIGVENLLNYYLVWEGKREFLGERRGWRNRNMLGGYLRSGGNLTHLVVYDSGHMVPLSQPEHSHDIVMNFIQGEAIQ